MEEKSAADIMEKCKKKIFSLFLSWADMYISAISRCYFSDYIFMKKQKLFLMKIVKNEAL